MTSLDLSSGELRLIEVKGRGASRGTILLTPNNRRVAEIPLVRSFWLCKKASRKRELKVEIHHGDTEEAENAKGKQALCSLCRRGEFPHVEREIFERKSDKDVPGGTVTRAKAACHCCGAC